MYEDLSDGVGLVGRAAHMVRTWELGRSYGATEEWQKAALTLQAVRKGYLTPGFISFASDRGLLGGGESSREASD